MATFEKRGNFWRVKIRPVCMVGGTRYPSVRARASTCPTGLTQENSWGITLSCHIGPTSDAGALQFDSLNWINGTSPKAWLAAAQIQIIGLPGGPRIGETGWRRGGSIINIDPHVNRRALVEIGARATAVAQDIELHLVRRPKTGKFLAQIRTHVRTDTKRERLTQRQPHVR
jgi:hypothetical protein